MTKRVLAGVLWFFAAWYGGNWIAFLAGVSPLIGPLLAVAAVALVVGDPLKVIWSRQAVETTRQVALQRLEDAPVVP